MAPEPKDFNPGRGGDANGLNELDARATRSMLVPLALAQFLASYDASSMNVAISRITEDLGTTVTGVQTVITLFTLTMAALMIPGSKLSDLWGRKRCFRLGIAMYGIGALVTALSPALAVMITGFSLLEGIGSALMIPPIYILITVSFADPVSRAKGFALVSAAGGLGSASGPLIGGFLTTTITWRASFLAEALTTLVILYASRRIVEPKADLPKREFDLLGAVLSAAGLALTVIGILQAGTYGWLRARKDFVIGAAVVLARGDVSPVVLFTTMGITLLVFFFLHVRRRERSGRPLLSTRLFESRTVNLGLVTQHVQWFMMIGTFFVVSVFLQVSRGYDAIRTGVLVTPATLGILIASTRMEKMTRKYPQRSIIRAGFVTALSGIALLLLLVDATSSVLTFIPGLFLIGFGAGIMLTASVNLVQSSVPDEDQGEISGISRSVSNLGSSLGTAIAGAVLISALHAGIASRVAESTVLSAGEKQRLSAALEHSVSAVSDAEVRKALQGKPQAVVEEVTRINAEARDRAMGLALAAVGLFGLIGLTAAVFLPANAGRPRPGRASTK
ncbi:MFS transporter [Polyangium jinanense]|uniref:MFS transporter n=1 Tax=Polyangium jinanense TaxID=2829994 RepID=A0A9X3XAH1_9BACT|nr:MFS transporter [Polyangium jinanense]MDC3957042.1 MFS transporter [Polyangium jinanense]MDC3987084.1 MFS transporter [Polyangium jinanense]